MVTERPMAWSKTNGSKSCLDHLTLSMSQDRAEIQFSYFRISD